MRHSVPFLASVVAWCRWESYIHKTIDTKNYCRLSSVLTLNLIQIPKMELLHYILAGQAKNSPSMVNVGIRVWRSWDRASLMYSFKYNQQDTTLCDILYCCQCSTSFRRFLRPSSGAQNCTHSIWYMSSLLAATASGMQTRIGILNLKVVCGPRASKGCRSLL
jgi:hypothetical protein